MRVLVAKPGTVATIDGLHVTVPSSCFLLVDDIQNVQGAVAIFNFSSPSLEGVATEVKQDVSSKKQDLAIAIDVLSFFLKSSKRR